MRGTRERGRSSRPKSKSLRLHKVTHKWTEGRERNFEIITIIIIVFTTIIPVFKLRDTQTKRFN